MTLASLAGLLDPELHLRTVGVLLLLLALLNLYVPRHFGWPQELARLSLLTRQVFVVHAAFIFLTLVLIGSLTAFYAPLLLEPGPLPRLVLIGLTVFWSFRLLAQWFYYSPELWRGNRLHTAMHVAFSALWLYAVVTLGAALAVQVRA